MWKDAKEIKAEFTVKCYSVYDKINRVIGSLETVDHYRSCIGWINNVYKVLHKEIPDHLGMIYYYDVVELIDTLRAKNTNDCMDRLDYIHRDDKSNNLGMIE